MRPTTKRILSTIAIIIASVAFGVVLSADLGFMKASNAQSSAVPATLSNAPVPTVTIPSFADVAARVMPAVVSIRSTEIIKTSDLRKALRSEPIPSTSSSPIRAATASAALTEKSRETMTTSRSRSPAEPDSSSPPTATS